MPRSIGQGARARHWPVHDPKTQSPAAATLLKLTRLSENGLAAIGAVTPLLMRFCLVPCRVLDRVKGWPQGGGLGFQTISLLRCRVPRLFVVAIPVPVPTLHCGQSTVGRPPKTSINLQPTSPVDDST